MTSHDATERVEHIRVEMIASVPNTFPLPASFLMMGSSVVVTLWKMRLFWARLRSFFVVTRSYSLSYTSILPALGSPFLQELSSSLAQQQRHCEAWFVVGNGHSTFYNQACSGWFVLAPCPWFGSVPSSELLSSVAFHALSSDNSYLLSNSYPTLVFVRIVILTVCLWTLCAETDELYLIQCRCSLNLTNRIR